MPASHEDHPPIDPRPSVYVPGHTNIASGHHLIQQHEPVYQTAHNASIPTNHPVFELSRFWVEEMHEVQTTETEFKHHPLPLARIKKVMKTDQDVKMISAEAPILFAKGCEIFIKELTKRAWVHSEENKRRTLQRSDIVTAISKTDMCDFLIDIVPREEANKPNVHYMQDLTYNNQSDSNAYYQSQYAPPPQIDPNNYYPPLSQFTNDQVQHYQMQLQQFAQNQNPVYEENHKTKK